MAEHLLASNADPTPERIRELRDAVDAHIAHGEHLIIPLLRNHLDPDGLERLADAIDTARSESAPVPAGPE
ncbi:MAG: hypothetical protein R2698_12115 [Microthrixaceae bacterium]